MKERHRHTESVVPEGTRWFVESYRPRLSVPGMFLTSGAPFESGDWIGSRNRWLVAIRSASGTGRLRWWQQVENGAEVEGLRSEIAQQLKAGRWPDATPVRGTNPFPPRWTDRYTSGRLACCDLHSGHLVLTSTDLPECVATKTFATRRSLR